MGQLLEIFGRGVGVETSELIWEWLRQAGETLAGTDVVQAQRLNKIIELAAAKRPTAMQQRLDEYRSFYPHSHYADLAGAAAALDENQLKDAVELLNSIYRRCPRNVAALYALGHCYERLERQGDAIAFYQDCLKFKSYLQYPRQRLAAIYFKNGQIEKTIREYELLVSEYPDDLATLLTLGRLYIATSQYKRALDTFSTSILIQPDNFCPDTDPIDTLIEGGEFSDALEEIDAYLSKHPDRPDLVLRRADVFAELGDDDQALDHYNQALAVCPNFLEANIKLGSHYLHLGRHSSAALQFTRAAQVNDRIVDAYLGLATAQKFAGSTSEALVSLSLAAAIENNGPLLLAEAARLQFHPPSKGRFNYDHQSFAGILNAQSEILKLHPHNPELYYRFGFLLMSIGRTSQAIELFSKALELNPTFSDARNKLAVCLYETGEEALAMENLIGPSCLQSETLGLYYRIALLYCDKVKFASSLLNLEQWLQDTLAGNDLAVNISIVLQNLGLVDSAVATCEGLSQLKCQAINVS